MTSESAGPFINSYMRKAEWRIQVWHVTSCINKAWEEYMHRQQNVRSG